MVVTPDAVVLLLQMALLSRLRSWDFLFHLSKALPFCLAHVTQLRGKFRFSEILLVLPLNLPYFQGACGKSKVCKPGVHCVSMSTS